MGSVFLENADILHIRTKYMSVESTNSMAVVERYHAPIRREFNIIQKEAPDIKNDDALQMALKAKNDSVGPDELVPTLLVFGALPRLGLKSRPDTVDV